VKGEMPCLKIFSFCFLGDYGLLMAQVGSKLVAV